MFYIINYFQLLKLILYKFLLQNEYNKKIKYYD